MKKRITLFLMSLLIPICCFSQTISNDSVLISKSQLKTINLIFNERDKLLEESNVYKSQIEDYKTLVNNYQQVDSIRKVQINTYATKLHKQKVKYTSIIGGLSVVSIVSIIFGIFK